MLLLSKTDRRRKEIRKQTRLARAVILNKSVIETCEFSHNPTTGCDQICFEGDCYAYQLIKRFGKKWGYDWTPQLHHDRLEEPFQLKKPSLIFCPSMGDLMTPTLLDLEINTVLNHMTFCDWHRFQVQTKFEKRLPEFKYPSNVWLGVSICYERDLTRIDYLLETDARIKYAYVEPLLEEMDPDFTGIDWVVIGPLSGAHKYQPETHWVKHIIEKATEVDAKIFLKNNLQLDLDSKLKQFPDEEWMKTFYPKGL